MAVQPYSATAPIKALAGTEASPGITFTGGDTNTGIYSPAANQLGITTGGTGKLIIDENGSLQVVGGTKDNPAIYFDEGTGIYSPGADQVAISTNGTERLFIDENGNVGIGTDFPDTLLHVEGNSDSTSPGSTSLFRVESLGVGTDAGIRFKSAGSSYAQIGNIGGELYAYADGSERLRITSDGKVGVGTSTPDELLHVELASTDTASIKLENTDGFHIFKENNGSLTIADSAGDRLHIDSSGNVGVGTVSPVSLLHVEGNSDDTSPGSTALLRVESLGAGTDAGIRFKSGGTTYSQIGSIGGELYAYTNGAERLRITTEGRLGVGTSTPGDRLELAGAGNGIVLASPDGTRYRLTVANGGTLSIAAV